RRGGRTCCPLESPGVPGIVAGFGAFEVRNNQVCDEYEYCDCLYECADSDEELHRLPAAAGLVGVDSARHPHQAGDVHQVKSEMESDHEQPEMELAEAFVEHSPGDFGIPVIKSGEESEQNSADDHVVKMGDDEVRAAKLPVKGRRREHDAGETGEQELEEESDAEKHRGLEKELAAPHSAEPVENLDSGGNADRHCREGEETVGVGIHADGEHVVRPHAQADESDANRSADHYGVSENRFARKDGNDFGDE